MLIWVDRGQGGGGVTALICKFIDYSDVTDRRMISGSLSVKIHSISYIGNTNNIIKR